MNYELLTWLVPALLALLFYGVGQGLVKKYISDVPPARFCLYFLVAKSLVNFGYYFSQPHPDLFDPTAHQFIIIGIVAYILDGLGWILYFKSIIAGPITIVGTLSAAYPALTVLFARYFLNEVLTPIQYIGVLVVIASCIGLSYAPADKTNPIKSKSWILMAGGALILWGAAQTFVKYSYGLPGASDVTLALLNTIGGALTLGVFGFLYGRSGKHTGKEWVQSFMPMGMMAAGDLGVIIASKYGPISIVTPLAGAYPVVTMGFAMLILKEKITTFQWVCIAMILVGIFIGTGS